MDLPRFAGLFQTWRMIILRTQDPWVASSPGRSGRYKSPIRDMETLRMEIPEDGNRRMNW